MINTKNELKSYISQDKKANHMEHHYLLKLLYGNDSARAFRYLKSLRRLEYYSNINNILRHWYRFINRRLGLKYNIFIVPNTVGPGLYLPHLQGGIIINPKSMGANCIVGPMVVIGNKDSQENTPTIGNNVEMAVGCKVIGKVTIGDGVIVAPNSVVIKDVEKGAIVSGIPAQLIKKEATFNHCC